MTGVLAAMCLVFAATPTIADASVLRLCAKGASSLQALSPNGEMLYLLWEYDSGNHNGTSEHHILFKRSLDNGATFESTVVLYNMDGFCQGSAAPRMVASDDNVYVVWQGFSREQRDTVMFVRSNDSGKTFTEPTSIGRGLFYVSGGDFPTFDITRTGSYIHAKGDLFYLIWIDYSSGVRVMFRASEDAGNSFGEPVVLNSFERESFHSATLAASDSNVHVVWINGSRNSNEGEQNEHVVLVRSSNDRGKTFGEPVVVHRVTQEWSLAPHMSAAGDMVYLIWTQTDDMMFSRSIDGGKTFSPAVEISLYEQNGGAPVERYLFQSYPHVVTFQADTTQDHQAVLAAWINSNEGMPFDTFEMSFAKSVDGGISFEKAKSFQFHGPIEFLRDRLAIDNGRIQYAWHESENGLNQIRSLTIGSDEQPIRLRMHDFNGSLSLPVLTAQENTVNILWFNGTEHGYLPDVQVNQQLFITRSTDGGMTFDEPLAIEHIVAVPEFGVFSVGLIASGLVLAMLVHLRMFMKKNTT